MAEKKIELLAPAGTWEAFEAAVNAGADAVYMGGKAFGARAYANNFDKEEMSRAVYFAHMHRVRLYITVNTLVDDSEMKELAEYLLFLNNVGVDGIIVQDMGVVNLARQLVPELPLHASTQMTITNSSGVTFAKLAGLGRSVLARELSLKEIEAACAMDAEIEVFIHGALCVCYSGQCLMSSLIGGRSGNRGRCAQPCRLPYRLENHKGEDMLSGYNAGQYLLSPRDLNTLSILPKLIEAGVISYKIEGRMKRPEYVAVVVDVYRRAIDSYYSGTYNVPASDRANIEQIFNRDFTTAYLIDRPGKNMMSDRRPNNRGVLVGRVTKLEKGSHKAIIKLDKELHVGDGLEFWVTVGGRIGTVITEMFCQGHNVQQASAGQLVSIDVPKGVRLNDRVFRTLNNSLMDYARKFYGAEAKKRISVDAVITARLGKPLVIELTDDEGNKGKGITEFIVESAHKRSLTEEVLRKQLSRLGTTEYYLRNVYFDCDIGIMVPISEINEARRKACLALDASRLAAFVPEREKIHHFKTELFNVAHKRIKRESVLTVHCDSLDQVRTSLKYGADRIIFGGDCFNRQLPSADNYTEAVALVRKKGRQIAFSTPRIVKEGQLKYFNHLFILWEKLAPDYVYLNNNSLWPLAMKYKGLHCVADISLNIFNSQSLLFWQKQGAVEAVLSPELTMTQVEHLAHVSPLPLECIIQGRLEMMVSEYCVGGSFLGKLDSGKCRFNCAEPLFLKDRTDARFPIATDQFCRMHILNAHELSMVAHVQHLSEVGINSLRIDGRNYSTIRLGELITLYRHVLDGIIECPENLPGTTRGHYFRGVI